MGKFGMQNGVGRLRCTLADLPNPDAVICAAGEEMLAIRTESDCIDVLERLRKSVTPLAGGNIPQFYSSIRAGAGENFSIWPESQTIDAAIMAGKRLQFLAGSDIPKLDLLVIAAGGHHFAIR